jgi:hypothetical protein
VVRIANRGGKLAGIWIALLIMEVTVMSNLTEASRDHIKDEHYAFPKERKMPIHDAAHIRNAIARFNQVKDVTAEERDKAWNRIKTAAKKHNVEMNEESWHQLNQLK